MPTNWDGTSSHVLYNTYAKVLIDHTMDPRNSTSQKSHQVPADGENLRIEKINKIGIMEFDTIKGD